MYNLSLILFRETTAPKTVIYYAAACSLISRPVCVAAYWQSRGINCQLSCPYYHYMYIYSAFTNIFVNSHEM